MIFAAFLLITGLLLWFIIGSKGNWAAKVLVIACSLFFCLSVGFSLENLIGWASTQIVPEKFRVHWLIIVEPDKKLNKPGAIYIWLQDSKKRKISFIESMYNINITEPRVHKIPYTKGQHEQANQALEMIMGGKEVGGTRAGVGQKPGDGEGEGDGKEGEPGPNNGEGQSGEGSGGSFSGFSGIIFHELPPTKLPEKK